jgi:hypothetical protein
MMSEVKEVITLQQLQAVKSSKAAYIGKYVLNALAKGVSCEELAADLQQFKESPEGQAEIQGHKAQALVCPDSCTLSQDSQGIA